MQTLLYLAYPIDLTHPFTGIYVLLVRDFDCLRVGVAFRPGWSSSYLVAGSYRFGDVYAELRFDDELLAPGILPGFAGTFQWKYRRVEKRHSGSEFAWSISQKICFKYSALWSS